MTAPAAATLVASVTSADASIASSLVPSVATSRPSTVPDTVILPVMLAPVAVTVPSTSSFVDGISDPIPTLPAVKYALYVLVPVPTLKGLMATTVVPTPTFLDA